MKFGELKNLVVASALAIVAATPAYAASAANQSAQSKDYITGYIGYFDIIRHNQDTTQFGLEYRAKPLQYNIRPIVGVNITPDSAVYGYVGLNWEAPLIDNQLYLIPNFAAGIYKKGDGKQLGGPIEFRSGIELAYQFPNSQRLGLAFNHISNASIYDHNPGSETLLVTYSVPLDSFR